MRIQIYLLSFLFVCCLTGHTLLAQTSRVTVTGTVTDRASKETIPGVSITSGTPAKGVGITDANGKFSVSIESGATLNFVYIGYATIKQKVAAGQTVYNIAMNAATNTMSEVVVRGYQKRNREVTTGSSFIVSGKEVQDVPVSNVEQLLQGKVPGLNIQVNTGAPGFRGSTQVRGLSSLSVAGQGSETFLAPTSPLIVIDGVPMDPDKASELGLQMQGAGVSPLSLIPQEDIQSIEILKDAQATSLYGSRGAYGVMLITTKRGNSTIPRVRYTTNFFVNAPPQLRETMGGRSERNLKLQQIYNSSNGENFADIYRITTTPLLSDSLNAFYNNATDWQGLFYQTTYNQTHNLMLDGGDPRFNYKANLGFYNENGVIKNTGFDRYNLNMNMQFKPNAKLSFLGSVFGSVGSRKVGSGVGLFQTGVASNGQASSLLPGPSLFSATGGVISSLKTDNKDYTRNLRANAEAAYEFIKGLNLTSNISYDFNSNTLNKFTPAAANAQFAEVYSSNSRDHQLYNRNILAYSKSFNDTHTIYTSVFSEIYIQGRQTNVIRQNRTPDDQVQGPFGYGGNASKGGGTFGDFKNARLASFAGALTYDFRKKYVVDITARMDGSSASGINNPYSYNPSVGLKWNFSKEELFENASWLSYAAVRATWGKNIVPNGNLQTIYGKYNFSSDTYNDQPIVYMDLDAIPNPLLKPTTTTQVNFGFDGGFFDQKVEINYDTYFKQVDNLIFDTPLPNILAFSKFTTNEAALANWGHELSVSFRPLAKTSKVNWSLNVNGAFNTDVLTNLPIEYNGQFLKLDLKDRQHLLYRVGKNSLSNFFIQNRGVYATDAQVPVDPVTGLRVRNVKGDNYSANLFNSFYQGGDPIFNDADGDYLITSKDFGPAGNTQPIMTGGISSNLSYKNFGLNIFATFTAKRSILNNALAERFDLLSDPFGTRTVGPQSVVPLDNMDVWMQQGDISRFPNPYNYYHTALVDPLRIDQSLWQEDGSYFKLNQITLSYMFDKKFIRRTLGLNSLRIYTSTKIGRAHV